MNKLTLLAVTVLSLLLTGSLRAQSQLKVDGVHSFVLFKVQHLGVSNAWGRFDDPSGTLTWDDADPSKSKLTMTVELSKVNTGNQKRDQHLRSPDSDTVQPGLAAEVTPLQVVGVQAGRLVRPGDPDVVLEDERLAGLDDALYAEELQQLQEHPVDPVGPGQGVTHLGGG